MSRLTSVEKGLIYDFLHSSPLGVLGTVNSEGQPQGSLIAFVEDEDLTILFESFRGTRKNKNLLSNNKVSLTVGFSVSQHITVQIDGDVKKVSANLYDNCRKRFKTKDTPCGDEFLNDKRIELFELKPTWIRYSDYNVNPMVFEGNL